jgi:NAD(P)-dependent dehydrogenase (short-subunit alcohol dehydrogenase family)
MGLIPMPFGFGSAAIDVAEGIDCPAARSSPVHPRASAWKPPEGLAAAGAEVDPAMRDKQAGARTASDITFTTGNDAAEVQGLDLTDLESVHTFVAGWSGPLHILINSAGVMAAPQTYTRHGWELQPASNHLGHFALATGLHPALAAAGGARIVVVSSTQRQTSPVVFDDLNFDFRPYDPWLAYGQSKTVSVLFAVEVSRRWASDGITANALMPGAICTNLQRHTDGCGSGKVPPEQIKTTEQGAAISALLATSPLLRGIGGRYFLDRNETEVIDARSGTLHGVARAL